MGGYPFVPFSMFSSSTPAPTSLDMTNLTHEYDMQEGSGTAINDSIGTLDGTLVGAAGGTWQSYGLELDVAGGGGPSSYIDFGTDPITKGLNNQNFTVGLVVRKNATPTSNFVPLFIGPSSHSGKFYSFAMLLESTGKMQGIYNDNGSLVSTSNSFLDGNTSNTVWYHLILKKINSGGSPGVYGKINDVLQADVGIDANIQYDASDIIRIGANSLWGSNMGVAYAYYYDAFTSDSTDTNNHAYLKSIMSDRGQTLN